MKKILKKASTLLVATIFTVAGALNTFAATESAVIGDINLISSLEINSEILTVSTKSLNGTVCDSIEQNIVFDAMVSNRGGIPVERELEVTYTSENTSLMQTYCTTNSIRLDIWPVGSHSYITEFTGEGTATVTVTVNGVTDNIIVNAK